MRKTDEAPQVQVPFNDKMGKGSNPLSLPSETWRKHQTKHDSSTRGERLAEALRQARLEAQYFLELQESSAFSSRQVAGALRAPRSARACGLDHCILRNWLDLPTEARDEVASILTRCEKGLICPHQPMQNAVALLGKSPTDDKPIHLTSLLYAVYIKIMKRVTLTLTAPMRLGGTPQLLEILVRVKAFGEELCLKWPVCTAISELTLFWTWRNFMTQLMK